MMSVFSYSALVMDELKMADSRGKDLDPGPSFGRPVGADHRGRLAQGRRPTKLKLSWLLMCN